MGYVHDAKKAGLHGKDSRSGGDEPHREREERHKGQKWIPADGEGIRFYGYATENSSQRNLDFPNSLTIERPRTPLPEVVVEPVQE